MGTCEDFLRTPVALNGCKNDFYVHFGVIPLLHHQIINGRLMAFLGNLDGSKAP